MGYKIKPKGTQTNFDTSSVRLVLHKLTIAVIGSILMTSLTADGQYRSMGSTEVKGTPKREFVDLLFELVDL